MDTSYFDYQFEQPRDITPIVSVEFRTQQDSDRQEYQLSHQQAIDTLLYCLQKIWGELAPTATPETTDYDWFESNISNPSLVYSQVKKLADTDTELAPELALAADNLLEIYNADTSRFLYLISNLWKAYCYKPARRDRRLADRLNNHRNSINSLEDSFLNG